MKTYAEIQQYIRDASDPEDGVDSHEARMIVEAALADESASLTLSQAQDLRPWLCAAQRPHETEAAALACGGYPVCATRVFTVRLSRVEGAEIVREIEAPSAVEALRIALTDCDAEIDAQIKVHVQPKPREKEALG